MSSLWFFEAKRRAYPSWVSGKNRVQETRIWDQVGEAIGKASAEFVRDKTDLQLTVFL